MRNQTPQSVLALFIIFSFIINTPLHSQLKDDCKKMNSQAVDSLMSYKTSFNKKQATLEASLSLLNKAIECDTNFYIAKFNKVTVLNELGRFPQAISLVNELIVSKKDSSLLLLKGPIYDKIHKRDSLIITYKLTYNYFAKKLKETPMDSNIIFGKIFSQSRVYGKESVKSEIDSYLRKYPNDLNLKSLLMQVLQE